jgi:hypothetical protein
VDEEHVGDVVDAEAGVAVEFVVVVNKMNVQRCGIRFSESNNQKSTITHPSRLTDKPTHPSSSHTQQPQSQHYKRPNPAPSPCPQSSPGTLPRNF